MKSFSLAKALALGALCCLSLPVACGDDESNPAPTPNEGGAGGEVGKPDGGTRMTDGGAGGVSSTLPPGLSDAPSSVECGATTCASIGVGPVFIDPCCAADACGLDTGFLSLVGAAFEEKCQAKGQRGVEDAGCPTTAPSTIPFNAITVPIDGFVGCCRENGRCGVVVDDVTSPLIGNVASLGLGCVDAAPFFPGEIPAACDASGVGGAGGGGTGSASEAGASVGGAGGNP